LPAPLLALTVLLPVMPLPIATAGQFIPAANERGDHQVAIARVNPYLRTHF